MIGAIEFRTEQDPDVARYTHPKDVSGEVLDGGLWVGFERVREQVRRGTRTPRTSAVSEC